jgi:hypothetical protein
MRSGVEIERQEGSLREGRRVAEVAGGGNDAQGLGVLGVDDLARVRRSKKTMT